VLYDCSGNLTLYFKTVLKSKVHICISHIYILVVSLLPRLGEPLAHPLELWFLHVCVDVSSAAPQVHGIVNVALNWEYPLGIVFIFSHERKDLYHV
jgi:hypothetical protein